MWRLANNARRGWVCHGNPAAPLEVAPGGHRADQTHFNLAPLFRPVCRGRRGVGRSSRVAIISKSLFPPLPVSSSRKQIGQEKVDDAILLLNYSDERCCAGPSGVDPL